MWISRHWSATMKRDESLFKIGISLDLQILGNFWVNINTQLHEIYNTVQIVFWIFCYENLTYCTFKRSCVNRTFLKFVLTIISFLWRWRDYYELLTKLCCFFNSFPMLICARLELHLWPLRLAAFSTSRARDPGFFHSSGLRLWILLCASRVYKSKNFWLASNVSLVERESGVGRRTHDLEHDINKFF